MTKAVANTNRIPEIDVLKGFAMICMIIGHSIIVYPIDISQVGWCQSLHNFIYSFHMEILFMLSGFLYKKKDYASYYKGKISRILIPYLIWGAIFLLMPVIFSSVVHRDTSLFDGLKNYALYGGGYWFLYALFLIFIIYPLIDLLGRWLKVILLVGLIAVNYLFAIPSIFCFEQVMWYLPFFMMGDLLRDLNNMIGAGNYSGNFAGITCLIFIATYLINEYVTIPNYFHHFIKSVSIIGIMCVLARYIFAILSETKDIVLRGFVSINSLCGKYSLQLYLFNGFLLVLLRVLLCSVLHVTNPIVIVFVISSVDIIVSLLVCVYILPKSKVLSFICGVKAAK